MVMIWELRFLSEGFKRRLCGDGDVSEGEVYEAEYEKYLDDVAQSEGEIEKVDSPLVTRNADGGTSSQSPQVAPQQFKGVDFGGLGEGDSATAGVRELVQPKDDIAWLAMIGDCKHPDRLTRLLFHADYCDSIGFKSRADGLRKLAKWKVINDMAKSGDDNRAKLALKAYEIELRKQFEIDKKAGLKGEGVP